MVSERNRLMTERRRNGETLDILAHAFGITRERVRQIVLNVERQDARARELEKADRLLAQPNPLHMRPRLREMVIKLVGKADFTPDDVDALGFTESTFYAIPYFRRVDWIELVQWMARAGKSPIPFRALGRPESYGQGPGSRPARGQT